MYRDMVRGWSTTYFICRWLQVAVQGSGVMAAGFIGEVGVDGGR
jgi:hypothetical protein